jgi:hypothetical protein
MGSKKSVALQSKAHGRPRKISISRHGTCSPEYVRLQSRR